MRRPPDVQRRGHTDPGAASFTDLENRRPQGTATSRLQAVNRLLVRWCWCLDATANRLTIWTGRLAAWATRQAMRNEGER